ncbi:protein of unknown function (4846) [Lutibacter oricola]|uniref:DUF4846 domain-containing protein n=1 Tax=Lutibacter oricola TaxID=762486 RepID=A0A1H2SZP9_9FLAO|nr:DUF4846 domain-containing protein [Lutibacter oricola]SDW36945.1 protein of unknown function (4846) [Lutibacter oricola]
MKKIFLFIGLLILLLLIGLQIKPVKQVAKAIVTSPSYLNKEGLIVKDRVIIPAGFERKTSKVGSFESYIRNYTLKPFGAKVINYDGSHYFNQIGHFGVLDIPVPENGLQQCADALIRIRSEYLWTTNKKNKIGFNFTSGHYCSWIKYAEGYRPKVKGNKVTFHKTATKNHSKENFYKYLNLIYMYSGTISLFNEMTRVNSIKNLQVGDMLIVGGSPGHVVMIGDVIKNDKGEKLFLLFQGNTPAQSVHLLKNLDDISISPWYNLELNSEVNIPGYTFYSSKFIRFK